MVYITERVEAENICKSIKEVVQQSYLDFYILESPFNLNIKIRKKFMTDFSPKMSNQENSVSISSPRNSEYLCSSPKSPMRTNEHSSSNINIDSGIENEVNIQVEEIRKELIKTIVESNKTIEDIKKTINLKDSIISKLNSEINSFKDNTTNLKKEVCTKKEQLKQKNQTISNLNVKLEKTTDEKNNLHDNLKNKVDNLDH